MRWHLLDVVRHEHEGGCRQVPRELAQPPHQVFPSSEVQAGGGLAVYAPDFDFDYLGWDVQLKARLGAQTQKGAGFGIYVVPGLGATNGITGDPSIAASGMVQFSAWMNK